MAVELIIRISGDSKKYRKELDRIERESDKTVDALDRDGKEITDDAEKESRKRIAISKREADKRIRNAKRVAKVLAVLAVAGITASIIELARFEKGLAGVSKTTDIVGRDLQNLGDDIEQIAIKTGIATGELLGIAQSAGQLGVQGSKNILKFTATIAKLGTATNLQGEAAATTLARLLAITKESVDDVDKLASVIVRLGNNFAATEAEIAFTATEIAGAGVQFGITSTEALGLAAAFSELAIQPELARSSVLRSLIEIDKAIRGSGEEMLSLISITGMTGEELTKTFKDDAVGVFQSFLRGLNRIQKGGGNTVEALEGLNLQGIRLLATLPKLAKGIDVVDDALSQAADEIENTTALQKEFEVQLDTTIGRAAQMREEFAQTKREIGEGFLPVTEDAIELLKKFAPFISNVLVPAIESFIDVIIKTSNFIEDNLIPVVVETFEKLDKMSASFRDAKTAIKDFLNIDLNEFEKLRKLIKEDIQAGVAVPSDQPDTTSLFGELLDPEAADKVRAINEQIAEAMAEARADEKEARELASLEKLEVENQLRQEELERLEEERAAKLERLREELADEEKAKKEAEKDREKTAKKAARDLIKVKKARVKEEERLDDAIADSAFQTLNKIVGDNKAAQLALLLAQKAVAVSRIIINTQEASALAFASQLIPGDPTSLARAAAASAAVQAAGAARIGVVLATAIPELVGSISGAQDGGIVPGGFGGGDRVPFLLEPGEIITPERLNPLSPNFDEATGGGTGGEVTVIIELSEDASQVLTASQREDTKLGVQL